jgi:hypothetical protein
MVFFKRYSLTTILAGALIALTYHAAAVPEDEELRKAHQSWFDGLLNEDFSFFEGFLAEDITLGFGMSSMPRADFLKHLSSGELFYDEAEHLDVLFRVYGDTGVVTGRSNLRYRWQGNEGFERLRYLAVYVATASGWKLVAWQSAIGED